MPLFTMFYRRHPQKKIETAPRGLLQLFPAALHIMPIHVIYYCTNVQYRSSREEAVTSSRAGCVRATPACGALTTRCADANGGARPLQPRPAVSSASPPTRRDQGRHGLRLQPMRSRTDEASGPWRQRCLGWHPTRHPRTLGTADIRALLTHLAVDSTVAASTHKVAWQALLARQAYRLS